MGRGLGVHKALDQIGAFAGPLVVAGLIAWSGSISPGLLALAVPGIVAMVLLVITRRRLPEPEAPVVAAPKVSGRVPLPPRFLGFAIGTTLCTAGLVTFGLISFSLVERHLVPTAGAPLLYAAAMAAGALAALATGEIYDRLGPRVLLGLPLLVAGVPALAFGNSLLLAVLGVLLWGAATGVQDSTVKALVADLVVRERRATAYGVFAALQGAGALLGGIAAGALYSHSVSWLVTAIVATQVVAFAIIVPVVSRRQSPAG
jgi:MFS family permease